MRIRFNLTLLGIILLGSCGEGPPTSNEPKAPESATLRFELLSPDTTGVHFVNEVMESDSNNYFNNQYIYNGGGVACGDLNGDGLEDIYFTGNSSSDKLYFNKGNFQFEDVSESSGILQVPDGWSTGVSFIDLNGDGQLDIYVCRAGNTDDEEAKANLLFMNAGDGTFRELGRATGLDDTGRTTQALFIDYDKDGDMDVYVMNHPAKWNREDAANQPWSASDHFYRNEGNGTFKDVTNEVGIGNYAFGLGIAALDVNQDGWDDIYVANDYLENDYLYLNDQKGGFKDIIKQVTNHNAQSAMGMDVGDVNGDGAMDFFVAEMLPSDYKRSKVNMASMDPDAFWHFIGEGKHYQYMHNVLQLNNGGGYFSDVAQMANVDKTDWSWSPLFFDADNDQQLDLFVSNGIKRDMMHKDASIERKNMIKEGKKASLDELYNLIPSTKLANYLFQNQGGLKFHNMAAEWGVDQRSFSNGATYADLNNDGALDLVVNNLDQKAFIYRNTSKSNHWLKVSLQHPGTPNPQGIGSSVHIFINGTEQVREVRNVRGFQSGVSATVHFGLSAEERVDSLTVVWDNLMQQTSYDLSADQLLTINYAPDRPWSKSEPKLIWENTSEIADFTHREQAFDDFKEEILLPHRQSTLGPMLEAADINGDGHDDFFVGGAAQQAGAIFRWENGGFARTDQPALQKDKASEDLGAVFFDADKDGDQDLYVVSGSNEFGPQDLRLQDRLYLNDGNGRFVKSPDGTLPEMFISGSRVVSLDIDNDGDNDLVVGGRAIPQKYPYPEPTVVLINENGKFTDQTVQWCPDCKGLGIVTDLDTADFDQDGQMDLIIVGEWMSPVVLLNNGDQLKKAENTGLDDLTGWWYGCKVVDWNNDGKLDILAGNIGLNHKFSATEESPFHLYANDFDSNGTLDLVLASDQDGTTLPIRGKQCLSEQMPFISEEKFDTYESFSNADIQTIFGEEINSGKHLTAVEFGSSIFIQNNELGFEQQLLPVEAQFSAIQSFAVVSNSKDGGAWFIAAGNLYETEVETTRADAGIGIVLNKEGEVMNNSGFFASGNVKDLCYLESGGAKFIAVANNSGKLQLFKYIGQ